MSFARDEASIRFEQELLKDVEFKLEAWEGFERYHRLYRHTVTISTEDGSLDLGEFPLQEAEIQLDCHDGEELKRNARRIRGIIASAALHADEANLFLYTFTLVPRLYLLSQQQTSRIFQEMSSKEIIGEILQEHGVQFEMRLKNEPRKREYCVQFEESDLDYVARLAEDDGYTFYVDQDQDKVIFVDDPSKLDKAGPQETFLWDPGEGLAQFPDETLDAFEEVRSVTWAQAAVRDYNYRTPETDLLKGVGADDGYGVGYTYLQGHTTLEEAETLARVRLEERRAFRRLITASSTMRSAEVGRSFNIAEHPTIEEEEKFQIIELRHHYQGHHYRNTFLCIPLETPYRPPRITPRPRIPGLQTATVVGPDGPWPQGQSSKDIYVDELGRIKVLFHWDLDRSRNERSSCWIRLRRAYAGPGYGRWFLPRVGNEVLVAFLHGDVDRPIVVGSVHNAENMPPVKLPDDKTQNTLRMPSTNELRFEDKEGQEEIYLHAQRNHTRAVENCESISVGANRSKTVNADQVSVIKGTFTETITGETRILIEEGALEHDVANNSATYHVKDDITEHYEETLTTKVTDAVVIQSTSSEIVIKAKTDIRFVTGASTFLLRQDGYIQLSGVKLSVDGAARVSVHGGSVTHRADITHDVTGAMVTSTGTQVNVLRGAMVMVN
jgi:type VI secretion system secreted protein VgrG